MKGCFANPQNTQRLAESLTYELEGSDSITQRILTNWLLSSTTLDIFISYVFNHLFRLSHKDKDRKTEDRTLAGNFSSDEIETVDKDKEKNLIPFCRGLDLIPSYPSLLDINQMVFINSSLPNDFQSEWRFLFSSEIHGESFSTLIGNSKKKIYSV